MKWHCATRRGAAESLLAILLAGYALALGQWPAAAAEVTLQGSMVCNGACIPDPKTADHVMVVFAIDGTAETRATVDRIMKDFYPDQGLDADSAQKLMDQF